MHSACNIFCCPMWRHVMFLTSFNFLSHMELFLFCIGAQVILTYQWLGVYILYYPSATKRNYNETNFFLFFKGKLNQMEFS